MNRRRFLKALSAVPAAHVVASQESNQKAIESVVGASFESGTPSIAPIRVKQWEQQFFREYVRDSQFRPMSVGG